MTEQRWQADTYQKHAGFVPVLGAPILALLDPQPSERILDLGCGDGVLTSKLVEAGASVMGIDSSESMINAAKERGLDAHVMDGTSFVLNEQFDAVFTNAALHWMKKDPDAVASNVFTTLKPGGRFVGEFGGHGNVAAITVAVLAVLRQRGVDGSKLVPWYFPTPEEYTQLLERAGFEVQSIGLIPRPTPLPTDMTGWLQTMAQTMFNAIEESDRDAALQEAVELLKPCLQDTQGHWTADYVRLRFAAVKPK
mmetsp:Transcript_2580/g.5517  ORF Transcript_2580/g.5517 Transcript_2580/m.5517 type:complete len:252 (+) Transcript_2580:63-818(+)|eukprot:568055-Amphidinium_carterae.1